MKSPREKTASIMLLLLIWTSILYSQVIVPEQERGSDKQDSLAITKMHKDIKNQSDRKSVIDTHLNMMDKTSQTYRSWNKICPVLGFKVNPKIKPVEYKGKLYGFCCKVCPPKFTQEPDKYINNLNLKGDKFVGKKPNN